jgi:cbb3-type cytochrome oxidase maturation protein
VSVIYVVLPLAILIAAAAVVAFAWAARKGQFDDLETPAHRMLIDDDPVKLDPPAATKDED